MRISYSRLRKFYMNGKNTFSRYICKYAKINDYKRKGKFMPYSREHEFSFLSQCLKDNLIFKNENCLLLESDSLPELKKIPEKSISLILTDPPYHSTKKKNITGDTNFNNDSDFLEWLSLYIKEWRRIIKPNGTIFCFCSAQMATSVENLFRQDFNVLSQIVLTKPNEKGFDGWKQKMRKESLRQWYLHSERIIFAEPSFGHNLKKTFFGDFLRDIRTKSHLTTIQLTELIGAYGKTNHGGAVANWEAGRNIPNRKQYERICNAIIQQGVFKEMPLYEDVIRPFNVNSDEQFTDVWDFKTVKPYKGKHPAEKPLDMLKHMIKSTTYENDIVLDCFSGSGSSLLAALDLNRKCIGMEIESRWAESSLNAIKYYLNSRQIVLNWNNRKHQESLFSEMGADV